MGQTQKTAPQISQQLKPVQAEIGRQAKFNVLFSGDEPIKVDWFRNDKEIKPSFEFQVLKNFQQFQVVKFKLFGI